MTGVPLRYRQPRMPDRRSATKFCTVPKRGLNRERLVAIAHDYVRANGLDALTMRRLAAAAEVTPGALYKHLRDKRDLERAMADAIFATVDLTGLDTAHSSADQVIVCCGRMRAAMLAFRDGGRIVAGAFSPFAATLVVSGTLRTLLRAITAPGFDAGELAGLAFLHSGFRHRGTGVSGVGRHG